MTTLELLGLLAGTFGRGGILLVAGFAGVRLLRRRSAAARYAVWAAAFTGLLLLPALTPALPVLEPPPMARAMPSPGRALAKAPPSHRSAAVGQVSLTGPTPASAPAVRVHPERLMPYPAAAAELKDSWRPQARRAAPWLLGLWLSGVLLVLARLARDLARIAGVTRRATPVTAGPLHALAQRTARALAVRPPVRVAITRELPVPVTWGWLHPVVLLPEPAQTWGAARLRVVLRHELAHARRGDFAGHLVIELACALHWPNPFAWRAAHRARLEQERACDDQVLALGTGPIAYAQHLLDLARTFLAPVTPGRGALAMAAAATLPQRMRTILDLGIDHRPAGRRTVLAVAGVALLVGVPTAALHPWRSGPRPAELAALLRSPDPLTRREAVWALAAHGSNEAREALAGRLGDPDPSTRGVAAWGLGKLGGDAALEPLVGALGDRDPHVREMAVLALGDLGDRRAVAALAPLAADPEHGVRSVMTVALRHIGGESAAEALAALGREDPDAHTRVMAVSALGHLASRARLPALQAALADPATEVRHAAAVAIEAAGVRTAVPALLGALAAETDIDTRDALIHALGAVRDPAAVDGLVLALGDSVPRLRERAAQMLGLAGDERAVEPLIAATRDPEHEVRLTAVWALDALQRAR